VHGQDGIEFGDLNGTVTLMRNHEGYQLLNIRSCCPGDESDTSLTLIRLKDINRKDITKGYRLYTLRFVKQTMN
jgi:hypothetical protein